MNALWGRHLWGRHLWGRHLKLNYSFNVLLKEALYNYPSNIISSSVVEERPCNAVRISEVGNLR
jgi:hypothetical protein